MQTRRSSRSTKGQHSKRKLDVYADGEESDGELKRAKVELDPSDEEYNQRESDHDHDHDDDEDNEDVPEEESSEVKCPPCGTTTENYNEETDTRGLMIECEACHTWQHAECMGLKPDNIPNNYNCHDCDNKPVEKTVRARLAPRPAPKPAPKPTISKTSGNLRDKTRASVAKAFLHVFEQQIPDTYTNDEGLSKQEVACKWAFDLESVIYRLYPQKDKHYTDKSRGIMTLIKKPNVLSRIISNELTFDKLVASSPEDIDDELKKYAEKVRQESIRRSVLTSEEDQGQRIRRTHKGEEIVENMGNQHGDVEVNIMSKSVDHRRFEEKEKVAPSTNVVDDNNGTKNYNFNTAGLDDYESEPENGENGNEEESKSSSDLDDDDALAKILKEEKPKPAPLPPKPAIKKTPLPPMNATSVWSGRINFPGFATFTVSSAFLTSTNYHTPRTALDVKFHNKCITVSKELLTRDFYEIEGRLDRNKADPYLSKIASSRDFYLFELKCTQNQPDYDKLYNYLLERSKIGVISGKPAIAKDSYLIALDGSIPDYFRGLENLKDAKGLFALYVVKKDYVPVGRSILKKRSPPVPQAAPPSYSNQNDKGPLLDSILSKLGGNDNSQTSVNISGGSSFTNDQRSVLQDIVQQNPQAEHNAQALIELLKQARGGL